MQERACGIETEYNVAVQGFDKKFYAHEKIAIRSDKSPSYDQPPSRFIMDVLPLKNDSPENLKKLMFFPPESDMPWVGATGGSIYFDNEKFHPEYRTPECRNPREAVLYCLGGDKIMEELRKEVLRRDFLQMNESKKYRDILILKSNAFYSDLFRVSPSIGCHESYTVSRFLATRSTQYHQGGYERFESFFAPFLATRQIFDGAGVIRPNSNGRWIYAISQKPPHVSRILAEGTIESDKRGLIHFRDKNCGSDFPEDCVRLHLICSDSNMSGWGKEIAMSATYLLLQAAEESDLAEWKYRPNSEIPLISDFHAISSDPTLKKTITLINKEDQRVIMTAPELQEEYAEFAYGVLKNLSPEKSARLDLWTMMIKKLKEDPKSASAELDWAIKQDFIEQYGQGKLSTKKTLYATALYHDISEHGLYNRLLKAGAVRPYASEEEMANCQFRPPPTRAEFRHRFIKTALENNAEKKGAPSGWGAFYGPNQYYVVIKDPLARTSEAGEELLRKCRNSKSNSDPPASQVSFF